MLENNLQKILIKFGLCLGIGLATMIIGVSNIFAQTVDVGDISSKTQVLADIPTASSGAPITLNRNVVNTYGSIYQLWFNVNNTSLLANTLYMFEIYTPQGKLSTNINWVGIQAENEVCEFVALLGLNGDYPKVYFKCRQAHTNGFTVLLNSTSTESITTSNFRWSYTYLRYFTDEANDIDWSAVTSNANQNANNIINNNNQNTQNIINNNNQNTQQQIESQKVCDYIDINNTIETGQLSNDGNVYSGATNFGVTDYIKIIGSKIKLLTTFSDSQYARTCFYNTNKNLISCLQINNSYQVNDYLTIPNNSSYARFTIRKSVNIPTFEICKNGNQALDDSINNLNDSLNNDNTSDAENEASEFFSSFNTETFGLTSIITAPLNLIQSILSSTCTSLQLPLPYLNNKYLELPCMSSIYSEFFGSFFTIYQTITYGIIAYWVCVRIFNQVKDFKNPEHDEIEVMDL